MADVTAHVHLNDVPEGSRILPVLVGPEDADLNLQVPYVVFYFPLEGKPRIFGQATGNETRRVLEQGGRGDRVSRALIELLAAIDTDSPEGDDADG